MQFAYTAKLLLSRENIREVIRCAEFLRMHNLEDSCFSFLQTQLLNSEDGLFVCRKDAACQRPHEDPEDSAGEEEDEEEETMDSDTAKMACPRDQMLPDPSDEPETLCCPACGHCPAYRCGSVEPGVARHWLGCGRPPPALRDAPRRCQSDAVPR